MFFLNQLGILKVLLKEFNEFISANFTQSKISVYKAIFFK
jgi:hypothetical protein